MTSSPNTPLDVGRVPDGTRLSSTTEPQEGLRPSGFDPSRDDAFWGPEIVVNGVKPEWLAPQEPYVWPLTSQWLDHLRTRHSYQSPFAADTVGWAWSHDDGRPNILAIRLPADHPAYSRDSGDAA